MNEECFKEFPVLHTSRFILRRLKETDVEDIFFIRSNEDVALYLDRPLARNLEDAKSFIKRIDNSFRSKSSIYWIIEFEKQFVGSITMWKIDKEYSKAELGFELLPFFQGKGILQEVLPIILDFGLTKLELSTIEAEVDKRNLKSIALLEKHNFIKYEEGDKTTIYHLKK